MKNRFVGVIVAIYQDGHEEKCFVKERKSKGKQHFLQAVCRSMLEIICHSAKGKVEVKYRGDFQEKLEEFMEYLKRHEKELMSISSDDIGVFTGDE